MGKVLIIKLGYSETLDKEISTTTSLGDVLRTTVILHYFKSDDVTWLVDEKAYLLLKNNKYINRILIYNLETVLQLQREKFDTVVNLEKVPGICSLSDSISAWRRFGFRFNENKGTALAYDNAEKVLSLCFNLDEKRKNERYWQQALAHMIGKEWKGEEYILGYKPKTTKEKYDVGLNWAVGNKWPNKALPKKHWKKLEEIIGKEYSISWQRGLNNLYEYINWINSCKLIITNDSMGMHLAIALKKKIIALFGPTSSKEICLYKRGKILLPKIQYNCVPCLKQKCYRKKNCMEFISPETIAKEVKNIL